MIKQSTILFVQQGVGLLNIKEAYPFPANLTRLTLVKHYPGGSGGVYELTDGVLSFMLKFSDSESHLKREILADTLYLKLGANVPRFAVYQDIPMQLRDSLSLNSKEPMLCRLSEKIGGKSPESPSDISALMKNDFVLHAYLGNRDIKPDNLILTQDPAPQQTVYYIDNGAFLSTRARGGLNTEAINHVIELETLRNPDISRLGAPFFNQISQGEIKAQIQELLTKQDIILNTAVEVNEALQLDFFEEIYEQLVARLHSLTFDNLAEHSTERKAAIEKKPNVGDAAGIFSVSYILGKPYVLLGRRNGQHQGTWCSLGGSAEKADKTFQDVAVREVEEESNGVLMYQSDEISFHPYFELATKQGLYRMYCSPTPYRQASLMNEHLEVANQRQHKEYEEFAWFSLESVLNALTTDNSSIAVEQLNERTLCIKGARPFIDTTITLYPDMYQMLKNPQVIEALSAFLRPPPKLPLRVNELKVVLAETMSPRSDLIKEVKSKFSEQHAPKVTPASFYSLSERHLDLLLNKSRSMSLENKINDFFSTCAINSQNPELSLRYDLDCRAQLKTAIEKEGEYQAQGYFTLYHAVPHDVSAIYDLYTAVYQALLLVPNTDFFKKFRLSELPFKKYTTLDAFKAHFSQGGNINNYDEDFPDMGLSANVFAFGSHSNDRSASYKLFVDDTSARRAQEFTELLATRLIEMGLQKPLIQLLLGQFKKIVELAKSKGGTLYQIHLPKTEMDLYVYPSRTMGKEYELNGEKKPLTVLLDAFSTGQWSDYKEITDLQARFFVHPEAMEKAVVIPYHHHHHQPSKHEDQQYKHAIRRSANFIFQALIRAPNTKAMYVKNPASNIIYQQQLATLAGVESNVNPEALLEHVLDTNQYVKLPYILGLYPGLLLNPELTAGIKARIKLFTHFSEISTYLNPEQMDSLLEGMQGHFQEVIKSAEIFNNILKRLSIKQKAVVFVQIKKSLPTFIGSVSDLHAILQYLSEEQIVIVIEDFKSALPSIIKSAKDFRGMLLPHLRWYTFQIQQLRSLLAATKEVLPTLIKTHYSSVNTALYDVLYDLPRDLQTNFVEIIADALPSLIKSSLDFNKVLKNLSPEQKTIVFNATQDSLPGLIKSPLDFQQVLELLTAVQRTIVFNATQDSLSGFIHSGSDFCDVLQHLSAEERAIIFEKMQDSLTTLIRLGSGLDFYQALEYLTVSQRSIIFRKTQHILPMLIEQSEFDIVFVLEHLSIEQTAQVVSRTAHVLATHITPSNHLALFLSNFSEEKNILIFMAIKDLLPTAVVSTDYFKDMLSKIAVKESDEYRPPLEKGDSNSNSENPSPLRQLSVFPIAKTEKEGTVALLQTLTSTPP